MYVDADVQSSDNNALLGFAARGRGRGRGEAAREEEEVLEEELVEKVNGDVENVVVVMVEDVTEVIRMVGEVTRITKLLCRTAMMQKTMYMYMSIKRDSCLPAQPCGF